MNKNVVILYNQITDNSTEDELDVLEQVEIVFESLLELGFIPEKLPFSINIQETITTLRLIKPLFIFNLVESLEGRNELISLSPLILNYLQIPYTGAPLDAMFLSTNKILSKQMLVCAGVPTSKWYSLSQTHLLNSAEKYILKPISEDGSVNLDEDSVFNGGDMKFLEKLKLLPDKDNFIEQFVDGREFNLSVLGGKNEPEVMPPAEILFLDYPPEKNKVVGYKAKWIEDSFEYNNTPRTFDFNDIDNELIAELKVIAAKCWKLFGLKGYARVDFRVDALNRPFVMEVNANPCIAIYSGFTAAAKQGGYNYKAMIERIIADALPLNF